MSFEIEKRKRKNGFYQADQTPIDSILTFLGIKAAPFELVVDLPLDECKERLEGQRKERGFWGWFFGGSEVSVDVWPASDGLEFLLLKKENKRPDVLIRGMVNQISTYTSLVSGEIRNSHNYLPGFCLLIFAVIWLSVVWSSSTWGLIAPVPALWFAFVLGLNAWFFKRARDRALERFEDAMTAGAFAKPKRKRTSFA